MRLNAVVQFAEETKNNVALVAPNELEKKLLFDSLSVNHVDISNIEFLTIDEAISHVAADYYILVFPDDMPAPLLEQLEYNGNIIKCTGVVV